MRVLLDGAPYEIEVVSKVAARLRNEAGRYLYAEAGGGFEVVASPDGESPWALFYVSFNDDDTVSFYTHDKWPVRMVGEDFLADERDVEPTRFELREGPAAPELQKRSCASSFGVLRSMGSHVMPRIRFSMDAFYRKPQRFLEFVRALCMLAVVFGWNLNSQQEATILLVVSLGITLLQEMFTVSEGDLVDAGTTKQVVHATAAEPDATLRPVGPGAARVLRSIE